MHGNCSSRLEALINLPSLLLQNIQLIAFDFSGCGMSEGDWVSLGHYEKDDLARIVDILRSSGKVSTIGLWGRSMGAATALLHGDRDPFISGMVIDSSFANLKQLVKEMALNHIKIPKFVLSAGLAFIRRTIKNKAGFDINDLSPIKHADKCFIPAMFIAARDDDFIKLHHSEDIYKLYAGEKYIIFCDGGHNSTRPKFLIDSIVIFFHNILLCNQLPNSINRKKDI